ncbi:MAG: FAD-binding oxidoreductase [Alphaproteobacteria bacterium]|nr:FAD-binding oxidoreductase [Alphaproteobacteria bacterium]
MSQPRRVFDGFGASQRSVSTFVTPRDPEELAAVFRRASEEGVRVAMRGSGRSYGDAALNGGQLIVDMRLMNQILSWDPETGIIETRPGLTIRELWQTILADGWWPPVVPGTAWPTLGGCASMNIHGKNHFKMGGIGDHILELDIVTPTGALLTLSREVEPELFHAVIAGFGMLGAITRVKLKMKQVESGRLRVRQWAVPDLRRQIEAFEAHREDSDYLVSWVDCIAPGRALGRAQVHRAVYIPREHDPEVDLDPDHQHLPGHIMGVPKTLVPKILKLFSFNLGMRMVNLGKYLASVVGSNKPYLQGHVAFHFLLDYVPNFREAYDPGGFIQYQPFVPAAHALDVFTDLLQRCQRADIVPYLGVLKRYRPDDFLLSHALDGFSLAMDFPVTRANRDALWALCHEMSDVVLEVGGRFYPAKDSVLRPEDFRRAFGQGPIATFRGLRDRVDPQRILRTEWAERVGVDGD